MLDRRGDDLSVVLCGIVFVTLAARHPQTPFKSSSRAYLGTCVTPAGHQTRQRQHPVARREKEEEEDKNELGMTLQAWARAHPRHGVEKAAILGGYYQFISSLSLTQCTSTHCWHPCAFVLHSMPRPSSLRCLTTPQTAGQLGMRSMGGSPMRPHETRLRGLMDWG